jgi:methylmalonyl-CoA mutase cobalamin-binding subunit
MGKNKSSLERIVGGSLGTDIHVAGLLKFLSIAEEIGYETIFLGPTISVEDMVGHIEEYDPDIVGVSYRLSPESAKKHLTQLKDLIEERQLADRIYIFGGTPATASVAQEIGIFDKLFVGGEPKEEVVKYLTGKGAEKIQHFPDNLVDRIEWKRPILRHHFGLPFLEETVEGVREIAEAGVLDIISIGPDQDAQEHFFHPERQRVESEGDGGVPLRTPEDLIRIYEASRYGNYPLLRCYAGTNDLTKMAKMYLDTIKNAWCAIPLTWYSVLDGRSERLLQEAVRENQELMNWHAERGIPVEVNESHQWSLRRAPDTIAVAMAYIAAYNAKKMGVKDYVSQYMFNTPGETSPKMDLGKMLAKIEMIESLHDETFRSYRQVRSGLLSFPTDTAMAKGQLVTSITVAMNLDPHIVHVVAYCEGEQIATPKEIIESCKMIQQVVKNYEMGFPDMTLDRHVQTRKQELIKEARVLIDAIGSLDTSQDSLVDSGILTRAVEMGLLDAPDLKGNKCAKGSIHTEMIGGACYAVDPETGEKLDEASRVKYIMERYNV